MTVFLFMTVLFIAAIMDKCTQKVYRFLWYIELLILGINRIFANPHIQIEDIKKLLLLVTWFLIQELIGSKWYGRADCHAFLCCGYFLILIENCGLTECFILMTLSFFILIIVEFFKGNISRRFSLKKPVPFIPYIFVGMLLMILTNCVKELKCVTII